MKKLHDDGDSAPVSPYVFLQAYGSFVQDGGENLDGESQQEAWQFVASLLQRLHQEDLAETSLVEELFNARTGLKVGPDFVALSTVGFADEVKLHCNNCNSTDLPAPEDNWTLDVTLRQSNERTSLPALLQKLTEKRDHYGYRCEGCEQIGHVRGEYHAINLSKYLIVQAPRVVTKQDETGRIILNEDSSIQTTKVHAKIEFPKEPLDLSCLFLNKDDKDGRQYEIFGMVEHRGRE